MMKLFKPAIFILVVLIAVFSIVLIKSKPKNQKLLETVPSASNNTGNFATDKVLWSKKIDELGADAAYKEYLNAYADKNFGTQHTAAHIMGTLLYEKKGIEGFATCDQSFAFGCYHSFFTSAITDLGLSVVAKLDQSCLDKYGLLGTGCQHGIGHGLMEYFGPKRLVDALAECKQTTQKHPLFGCTSGVFMEYNLPVIIDATNTRMESRKFDEKNINSPCTSVPAQWQGSCYFELTQWWAQSTPYKGDFKKIGSLCQAVTDEKNRHDCFLGIGNVAGPNNQYNAAATVASCKKMPNLEATVTCQSGASWSFYAMPQYKSLASELCKDLDSKSQELCAKNSDLIGEKSL